MGNAREMQDRINYTYIYIKVTRLCLTYVSFVKRNLARRAKKFCIRQLTFTVFRVPALSLSEKASSVTQDRQSQTADGLGPADGPADGLRISLNCQTYWQPL